MILKSEYDQIIREWFDLSDNETRHYIATLEDAGKDQLLSALSNALYDQIVSKVEDIDFGSIPMSRGDITKVQGWQKTEECINTIRNLVVAYKQDTNIIDILVNAVANVKDRKAVFIKGYALNVELPMLLYNLIVLSIERSLALMISTCVQFVKDPQSSTMKKALDKAAYKNTMDDMLFQQLDTFNKSCKNKSIDKILDSVLYSNPVKEEFDFRFDVVSPIDDEDPTNDAGQDSPVSTDFNPFDNSTTEPFGHEGQPDPEFSFDNDDDEEIPITLEPDPEDDFPEYNHDDFGNPINNDTVEPDHIDTVVPGDSVSDSNRAINEDELQEANIGNIIGGIAGSLSKTGRDLSSGNNLNSTIKNKILSNKKVIGGLAIAAAVVGLPFLIKHLIKNLRQAVYNFYYYKLKFKDYLEIQATLIESNANEVEQSTELDEDKKKKVVEKQRKTAEKLRNWANKIQIDKKQAENKSKKDIKDDEKDKKKVHTDEDGEDVLF